MGLGVCEFASFQVRTKRLMTSVVTDKAKTPESLVKADGWLNFDAIAVPDDDDGGFAVFALHYPGVISQCDTIEEASENIAEAFLLMRDVMGSMMEYTSDPCVPIEPGSHPIKVKVRI